MTGGGVDQEVGEGDALSGRSVGTEVGGADVGAVDQDGEPAGEHVGRGGARRADIHAGDSADGGRHPVTAVCPGSTATWPGTQALGARPVEQSAAGAVWAATRPDDGPTGGFFRDGGPLPW